MIKTEATIRKSIISWNNLFPLDRWWRHKYKIPYASKDHRDISQISIYLEWKEEKIYQAHEEHLKQKEVRQKDFKKGIWIQEYISPKEEEDLFDAFNIKDLQ